MTQTLDWSDRAFAARTPQHGWIPVYITGWFGDPHLAEFPGAGPSPAPYSFKAFRAPDGRYFKMAGRDRTSSERQLWPMIAPVLLRFQPPEQSIR